MNGRIDPQMDDALAVCDAVDRYVRLELAPLCVRSETPIPATRCRCVVDGLSELGVLSQADATGWGVWDDDRSAINRRVSIRILRCVGRQSTAVGYQVHLQAMAAWLDRLAGVRGADGPPLVSVQGHLGLGRDAFPRSLAGATLTPGQQAILGDDWAWPTTDRPRWLHALPDWTALWIATWEAETGWEWRRVERARLVVQSHPHSLGLDELTTQSIAAPPDQGRTAPTAVLTGRVAADAQAALQAMHAAALLALSQSAVEVAWDKAQAYARTRYQGGQMIVGHAAVKQLLSLAVGAAEEASQALERLGDAACAWPDLRSQWRDRARCQVSLSAGASAALQVFGGMGYMRDNAMEKLLRQVSHLRLLGGSPAELSLSVADWDASAGDPAQGPTATP